MIFPAANTNTLTVVTNPTDSDRFPDNRVAVTVGNNQVLRCVGSGSSSLPSVVWVRNGEQVIADGSRITITERTMLFSQQSYSELEISNFTLSDAGVYQCIFTEGAEVITTTPLRLDTGWYIHPTHSCYLQPVDQKLCFGLWLICQPTCVDAILSNNVGTHIMLVFIVTHTRRSCLYTMQV